MSGSERLDLKEGPLGNLSQAYFGSLDKVVKGYEPALKGIGRWNVELMGLAAKRSREWLEMPARLTRCKSPVDFVNEQMRFWQTAAAQYADASHRLAAAFGACAVTPYLNGLNGAWGGDTVARSRDYITFPEPKDGAADAAASTRSDRRAA
jgi:hypothetical protein